VFLSLSAGVGKSLVPGIPVLFVFCKTWMAGTSPAMTECLNSHPLSTTAMDFSPRASADESPEIIEAGAYVQIRGGAAYHSQKWRRTGMLRLK
jgi:hypothetical protein